MKYNFLLITIISIILTSCSKDDGPVAMVQHFEAQFVKVGSKIISDNDEVEPNDITITFEEPIDITTSNGVQLTNEGEVIPVNFQYLDNNKILLLKPVTPLIEDKKYSIEISSALKSDTGKEALPTKISFQIKKEDLKIQSITIGQTDITKNNRHKNIALRPSIEVSFSHEIDSEALLDKMVIVGSQNYTFSITEKKDTVFNISLNQDFQSLDRINILVPSSLGEHVNRDFNTQSYTFYTQIDSTNKFPLISDEELLTKVQEQTFKYFWDFGHPVSGMARERNTSGEIVTTGGTGFGLMAMIVAVERDFITKSDALERWNKIVNFLEKADRFHGAWSHWLNGTTGKVIPFSEKDNGGDLVETAFLAQGLITVRQYLDKENEAENTLIEKINTLLNEIEWNWYQRDQNVLFWHWSPNFGWDINLPIRGHNETQIVYVLAAASSTYGISKEVYDEGYAKSGNIKNGTSHYNYELPLGNDLGGPLFFSHYSYLGLDPRNLMDEYANYWIQNKNHTLINRAYCIANPKNYVAYSDVCWGLTASDNHTGYSAHSPANDLGVITPTAALSSMPYTPEMSMDAMRFFYYQLGDKLWGEYGFIDAFNPTENWYADSFLAIDQGPIICMIENHRTELLWNLFMSAPEVEGALTKLNFISW